MKKRNAAKPIRRVLIAAVLCSAVAACGSAGTSGSGEEGAEVVTLKVAEFEGEESTRGQIQKAWGDMVEERTEGRVKVDYYWSESLVQFPDMVAAVGSGAADVGVLAWGNFPTEVPLASVVDGPLTVTDMESSYPAVLKFFREYEPVVEQFADKNLVLLYPYLHPGDIMLGSDDRIESIDDMRDMKAIRGLAGLWEKTFSGVGLNVVAMPGGDVYTALERGTLDANSTWMLGHYDHRWYEQVNYLNDLGLGSVATLGTIMNKESLEALSPEDQEIVMSISDEIATKTSIEINDRDYEKALKAVAEEGVEVVKDPPAGFAEAISESLDEHRPAYLKSLDDQGMPATEAFEAFEDYLAGN